MFRIGDHIVAVRDYREAGIKQGDEFIVQDVIQGCCSSQLVAIGMKKWYGGVQRCRCGAVFPINTDNLYFHHYRFAPLLNLKQAIEELMLEPVEL